VPSSAATCSHDSVSDKLVVMMKNKLFNLSTLCSCVGRVKRHDETTYCLFG